jgi:hypothetical protein
MEKKETLQTEEENMGKYVFDLEGAGTRKGMSKIRNLVTRKTCLHSNFKFVIIHIKTCTVCRYGKMG